PGRAGARTARGGHTRDNGPIRAGAAGGSLCGDAPQRDDRRYRNGSISHPATEPVAGAVSYGARRTRRAGGPPARPSVAGAGTWPAGAANRMTVAMTDDIAGLIAQREGDRYALHSRHLNEQMVRVLRTIGYDVGFVRGQGQYLYDRKGERYLDLLSG